MRRRIPVEFFCGLDQYISEPSALQMVYRLFKTGNAKLFLVELPSGNFHPKMYCFFESGLLHLVIGSANVTGGGLAKNAEISISFAISEDDPIAKEVKQFRQTILDAGAEEANPWNLSQYARKHKIIDLKRRKAEKEAFKEISHTRFWKLGEIEKQLDVYKSDAEGAERFAYRLATYVKAKDALTQICSRRLTSPAAFLALYGPLVGVRGEGQLWFSSGLQRGKNKVAKRYKEVIRLIREIRANISKSPEEVFAIALRMGRSIDGMGANTITEIMHTFEPRKFPILNVRPLVTLEYFGHATFSSPNSFHPADYAAFTEQEEFIREHCKFKAVAQVDHFLDFVYSRQAKQWKKKLRHQS